MYFSDFSDGFEQHCLENTTKYTVLRLCRRKRGISVRRKRIPTFSSKSRASPNIRIICADLSPKPRTVAAYTSSLTDLSGASRHFRDSDGMQLCSRPELRVQPILIDFMHATVATCGFP